MSESQATKMLEAARKAAQATATADERSGPHAATGDGAVPASTGDGVSPYDPVFGPGVNFDDTALDAYGRPYRIAGAAVTEARTHVAPDETTTAGPGTHDDTVKPRAKKQIPAVAAPGLDRHNITPVPFVDDKGRAILNKAGQPMMRPAGIDPHFFVAEGLKIREMKMAPFPKDLVKVPEAEVIEAYQLSLFRASGLWDAQRVSGRYDQRFRDYASVAIGLYAAAAGMSEKETLDISNIVAAMQSHFAKKDTRDTTYTHLPVENVDNTKTGYRLYQSGLIGAKARKP
jgi:hypothetical protein